MVIQWPQNRPIGKSTVLRSRLCGLIDIRPAIPVWLLLSLPALAHEPKPEALAAFERYRALTEARMDSERRSARFLIIDGYPPERLQAIEADLRRGEFYLEQLRTLDEGKKIPGTRGADSPLGRRRLSARGDASGNQSGPRRLRPPEEKLLPGRP